MTTHLKYTNKEIEQIVTVFILLGYKAEKTGGGHTKITNASGQQFFFASTPSDPRAVMNIVKDAKKYLGTDLSALLKDKKALKRKIKELRG